MEYTIYSKVSERDEWGIIGHCLIFNGTHIPEGAILHIWGGGRLKGIKVRRKEPKTRHRNLFRFIGFERLKLFINMPEIPVIRVVPLHLE